MKFSTHMLTVVDQPFEEWRGLVRYAEDCGLDMFGVGDVQTKCLECYVSLTMLALHSTKTPFASIISNPVTRHPGVVASSWASLQRLSGGRAIYGVSTGNSALHNLSVPPAGIAQVEEHVRAVRELLRDGTTSYRGAQCHLPWAPRVAPGGVPVYLAANGLKSLHLGGRIADGIFIGMGITKDVAATTLEVIEQGARSAGRRLEDIDLWWVIDLNTGDDDATAQKEVLNTVASVSSRAFRSTFEGKCVPKDMQKAIRQFEREYDYTQHGTNDSPNEQLMERLGLKEFLAERFSIAGRPETVARRLKQVRAYGVENIHYIGLAPDLRRVLTDLTEKVRPQL